jgi:DNA-binding transcriptional MerR regulator
MYIKMSLRNAEELTGISGTRKLNEYDDAVKNYINRLKMNNIAMELKGSSVLKKMDYPADFDLYSNINQIKTEQIFGEVNRIVTYINNNNNIYFMELKIQDNKNNKYRYYPDDKLNRKTFMKQIKDLSMIKIDTIIDKNGIFKEMSLIYSFNETKNDPLHFTDDLVTDINSLVKQGKYFKTIKRLYSLQNALGNYKKLNQYSKILNSKKGANYQLLNNLDAVVSLLKFYDDDLTKHKVVNNLKNRNLPKDLTKLAEMQKNLERDVNDSKMKNFVTNELKHLSV